MNHTGMDWRAMLRIGAEPNPFSDSAVDSGASLLAQSVQLVNQQSTFQQQQVKLRCRDCTGMGVRLK